MTFDGVPSTRVWAALDGDDIGRRIEQLVSTEDLDGLSSFSREVARRLDELRAASERSGGHVVLCTGDILLTQVSSEAAVELCKVACSLVNGVSFSGGIGTTMSQAMLALKAAKARGRRQWLNWSDLVRGGTP
jgi:hypothetical protein